MNIDERLEALTMNLELASRDIQDLRAAQQELTATVGNLAAVMREGFAEMRAGFAEMRAGFADTVRTFGVANDSIRMLGDIAADHDRRLDDLENKQ